MVRITRLYESLSGDSSSNSKLGSVYGVPVDFTSEGHGGGEGGIDIVDSKVDFFCCKWGGGGGEETAAYEMRNERMRRIMRVRMCQDAGYFNIQCRLL